jgi:CMP-N,N'-diacetyllegionaminic acid synthase
MMKNIAIIPARSGSKGLPDKNIKELAGKPLIAHSIEAALKSECFNEVMVSTDSEKYADIARAYGAKVPFLRSTVNASDISSSWDVVSEVLNKYEEVGLEFDTFCLLQPTSPLRTADDIRQAYRLYDDRASFAVVSVCPVEHSPLWTGKLGNDCDLNGFISPDKIGRRQDAGKYFRLNGAIYIADINRFKQDRFFYQKGSYAYIMPNDRSVDIDTELDFEFADFLFEKIANHKI